MDKGINDTVVLYGGCDVRGGIQKGSGAAMMGLQISHQAEWALTSSDPLIIVSGRVGHNVMKDDATLVLQAVRRVLRTKPVN